MNSSPKNKSRQATQMGCGLTRYNQPSGLTTPPSHRLKYRAWQGQELGPSINLLVSQLLAMKPPLSCPNVNQVGGLKYVRSRATGMQANMIAKKIAGQIMMRLMSFFIKPRRANGMEEPNARYAPMYSPFVLNVC